MKQLTFFIKDITEDDIKAFMLSQMAQQEAIQWALIIGIAAAIIIPIAIVLWYFLHPNSPRQRKLRRQEDEEARKRRKEEELQRKIGLKLKELNYTCQHCKAPGLKGPKCEYCAHINFSIEEL
ncbi:MAG: hypothetical protein ACTSO9_10145 [Candidatus Helarchaeota archaeon]